MPVRTQITGNLKDLRYDYYFDSRDGAERSIDVQGAQVIQQLLTPLLGDAEIRQALGKKRVFDLINATLRLSGAPTDVMIQTAEGEDDTMEPPAPAPQQAPQQQASSGTEARIARLEQMLMQAMQGGGQPPAPGPVQPNQPMPPQQPSPAARLMAPAA